MPILEHYNTFPMLFVEFLLSLWRHVPYPLLTAIFTSKCKFLVSTPPNNSDSFQDHLRNNIQPQPPTTNAHQLKTVPILLLRDFLATAIQSVHHHRHRHRCRYLCHRHAGHFRSVKSSPCKTIAHGLYSDRILYRRGTATFEVERKGKGTLGDHPP